MRPSKSVLTHYFEAERQPAWPDLPWPEWKPETKKMMRPERVTFTISLEGNDIYFSDPKVFGRRVLANNTLGTTVSATYFKEHMPPFVAGIVEEAKWCIK